MATERKGLAKLGSVIRLSVREMDPLSRLQPEDLGIDAATAKEVAARLHMGAVRLIGVDPSTTRTIKGDEAKGTQDVVIPGKSWLAPIQAATRKARDKLNSNGLQFLGFEGARFVPYELQAELYELFKEAKKEHDIALEAMIENYDKIKTDALLGAAEALTKVSGDNEASQVAYRRILAKYPTKDQMRAKFGVRWEAFHAVGVNQGGEELTEREELERVFEQAEGMMAGLRKDLIDGLKTIMDKATEGGKLRPASVSAAQRAFDRADALNVLGDKAVIAAIRRGRALLANLDRNEKLTPEFKSEVESVISLMEGDVADAVKAVQDTLTGLGRRKIAE
jgi:hypothetical protein